MFNQTVTITEKEDGLDGETYVFLTLRGVLLVCSFVCVERFFLSVPPYIPASVLSLESTFVLLLLSQHLHVRLPVGSRAAGHRWPSPAAGVQKGTDVITQTSQSGLNVLED